LLKHVTIIVLYVGKTNITEKQLNKMGKYICAECKHWKMGDIWGSNSRTNSTVIACKGWCYAKPNKRKRWNYAPASNCQLFDKREQTSLIMSGCGLPTEEQLNTIVSFVEEKLGKQ